MQNVLQNKLCLTIAEPEEARILPLTIRDRKYYMPRNAKKQPPSCIFPGFLKVSRKDDAKRRLPGILDGAFCQSCTDFRCAPG